MPEYLRHIHVYVGYMSDVELMSCGRWNVKVACCLSYLSHAYYMITQSQFLGNYYRTIYTMTYLLFGSSNFKANKLALLSKNV